jgi:hypothetical protein
MPIIRGTPSPNGGLCFREVPFDDLRISLKKLYPSTQAERQLLSIVAQKIYRNFINLNSKSRLLASRCSSHASRAGQFLSRGFS